MYGEKDVVKMNHDGTAGQRSFETYAAELMQELYPDSDPSKRYRSVQNIAFVTMFYLSVWVQDRCMENEVESAASARRTKVHRSLA